MKTRGETLFALVLLIVFITIVGLGMGYSKKARMLPLVLGIPGVLLTAVIVTRNCNQTR